MSSYSYYNEYATVSVTLTQKEARSGCICRVRYPDAPEPLRVQFPRGTHDGDVLYVDAPVYNGYGGIEEQSLRILVSVKKPNRAYAAGALLAFVAAAALGVILTTFLRDARTERVPAPEITITAQGENSATANVIDAVPSMPQVSQARQEAQALIPHFELRYYLSQLDDRLLSCFCDMYSAVSSFSATCNFDEPLTKDELSNLALLLTYECPELLQFSSSETISFYTDTNDHVISAQLPLALSREEYESEYRVCSGIAQTLAAKAEGMSEYEKELIAYEYITSNCFYSYDSPNAGTAYGALGEREAKCDGISLAMKWLCEEMGISCMVMAGNAYGDPVGHAWNVVCIDGTYYDLDVTNDVNTAERDCNLYPAFNVSRHWIRAAYPDKISFSGFLIVPGSESMNMSYHALNGSFVAAGEEYEHALFNRLNSLQSGESAFIQFESDEDYKLFISSIHDIMGRWGDNQKAGFNYHSYYLDSFRVCRITITYL